MVQGDGSVGAAISGHDGIDKMTVTGSVPTGRAVMRAAADAPMPVTLELGGKSPVLVFDDADMDRAVDAAVMANFATQGEVCSNGTRVFVQASVHDEFVDRFVAAAEALVVGDPLDPATQVGSLISDEHLDKVLAAVRRGQEQGARAAHRWSAGDRRSDGGWSLRDTCGVRRGRR